VPDIDDRLRGAGSDRPLPPALRARLETALTHSSPGSEPVLEGIDAPRAVPPSLQRKIEGSMASIARAFLDGIAEPRTMPPALRARLEAALIPRPRLRLSYRIVGAAAAALLLVSSALVVARTGSREPTSREPVALPPAPEQTVASSPGAPGFTPTPPPARVVTVDESVSGGNLPVLADLGPGAAPPFSYTVAVAPPAALAPAAPGSHRSPPRPPPPPPIGIGVIGGNASETAGFRAYIDLVNRSGGVRRHRLNLITVSPSAPAPGTIATVNLSDAEVAGSGGPPAWAHGPLLETLAVRESVLHGNVFDVSSAPEHQAHLAAASMFPGEEAGKTALIYHAREGFFSSTVPKAFVEALEARGVTVVSMAFEAGDTPVFIPASAAFLSLDTEAAGSWLAAAQIAGYTTPVAGVYSLYDSTLLDEEPEGTRILSPYGIASADEMNALRSRANVGAASIHGWMTAKAIAAAIWRSDAVTPSALTQALSSLGSYSSGFVESYRVRQGTNSRIPEAITLEAVEGAFHVRSDFLEDTF
jgi:hypothetical protein